MALLYLDLSFKGSKKKVAITIGDFIAFESDIKRTFKVLKITKKRICLFDINELKETEVFVKNIEDINTGIVFGVTRETGNHIIFSKIIERITEIKKEFEIFENALLVN